MSIRSDWLSRSQTPDCFKGPMPYKEFKVPLDETDAYHPDFPSVPEALLTLFIATLEMDTSTPGRKAKCIIGATTIGGVGGAAVGSVVPGIGTASGAAGGASIGFVASTIKVIYAECKRRKDAKQT